VYGLHPLLPIEYFLPSGLGENRDPRLGENKDPQLIRTLINRLSKLEKRKEIMLIMHDLVTSSQWNKSSWS